MNKKSTLGKVANNYLTHTKNQRGITLVALVITIIILLILAGIAITALIQTNLLQNAKEAKQKTENAQNIESKALTSYEEKIGDIVGTRQFDIKSYTSSSNCYTVPQAGIVIASGRTTNGWGCCININEIPIRIIENSYGQTQTSSYSQLVTKENKIYFSSVNSDGTYSILTAYFVPFK